MKTGEVFFGRRIRQNHALEHATITILSGMVPDLRVSARSSSNGFIIFGDVDLGLLRRAVDEALRRLHAGEGEKEEESQTFAQTRRCVSPGAPWARWRGVFHNNR